MDNKSNGALLSLGKRSISVLDKSTWFNTYKKSDDDDDACNNMWAQNMK